MTPEEHIFRSVEALLKRMRGIYDDLANKYPRGDLRLTMIAGPGNSLRSLHLFFSMVMSTITHESWWKATFGPEAPSDLDKDAIKNLDATSRYSYFVFFLSQIEWSMRKLVTHISPGTCGNGAAEFKAIHDHLLNKLGFSSYIPLYDFCRTVRNCVHSNATYISKSGKDLKIVWKESTYQFRHMSPVDFMTYELILQHYGELVDSLEAIVKHPMVASPIKMDDKIAST